MSSSTIREVPARAGYGSKERTTLYGSASSASRGSRIGNVPESVAGTEGRVALSKSKQTAPEGTLGLMRVMQEFHRLDPNMPVSQSLIFLHIASHSHRQQGPTIGEIAADISMTESRVSRNVQLLEDARLISKDRDPLNSRVRLCRVTPEGFGFLERLTSLVTRH